MRSDHTITVTGTVEVIVARYSILLKLNYIYWICRIAIFTIEIARVQLYSNFKQNQTRNPIFKADNFQSILNERRIKPIYFFIMRALLFVPSLCGLCISIYGKYLELKLIDGSMAVKPVCDVTHYISCTKPLLSEYGYFLAKVGVVKVESILNISNTVLGI